MNTHAILGTDLSSASDKLIECAYEYKNLVIEKITLVHALGIKHIQVFQDILRKEVCLTMMGSQGRGYIPETFLGSVSHQVASVVIFVVVPLIAGVITQQILMKSKGEEWFKREFLPKLKPVSIIALLITLVLLFAFQGQNILSNPLIILLAAVPLVIQTYFIFFLAWYGGRKLKLNHAVCGPAAMIGASNFFEKI